MTQKEPVSKKEYEELKNKIKKLRKNLALEIELTARYRKVLEEIEEYVRDNSDFDKSDILTSKTGAYDILNIINKAKGEGNE